MLEFTKYDPETPEEDRKGAPVCVVTYPKACGRAAVGEVWGLSFCEAHGTEAHAAARLEAYEDAGRELDALMGGLEGEHAVRNPLVYEALRGAKLPGWRPSGDHGEIIRAAYDLAGAATDPDTLVYNYSEEVAGDTPYDWQSEAREMIVGFMREAYEACQPTLIRALEPIREHATVQQELALDDMDRRYVQPRRAAREERREREAARTEEAGHEPREILAATNGALSSATDLLDGIPPESFGDADAYFRAKCAIAEAGGLVATAQTRGTRPAG